MPGFPPLLKRNRRGFSLLELLVAMVILSLVVALLYSTWWMGIRATKRTHEIAQKYMEARVFLNFLEKELRSAVPFSFPGYANFEWDPKEKKLAFWQTTPDSPGGLREPYPFYIHRNTYYLQNEGEKKILYKEIKPLFPGKFDVAVGPALQGDFDLEIDWGKAKVPPPLPEKVKVLLTLEGGQRLHKEVYINEARKLK